MAHGKSSRSRNREKRKAMKVARKAANKAKYAAQIAAGTNYKDKTKRSKQKRKRISTVSHPLGKCGNIGCKLCNPCNL
jgi:hypothetical protein